MDFLCLKEVLFFINFLEAGKSEINYNIKCIEDNAVNITL